MSRSGGRDPPRIEGMTSLKVDNLAYRTAIEDLRRIFGRYGELGKSAQPYILTFPQGDVYIPKDPYSNESRGFAFIRFYSDRDAEDAIRNMDGRQIDGREIRVQRAKYGRPNSARSRGGRYSPSPRRGRRSRTRSRSRSTRRHSSGTRYRSRSRSRDIR